MSLCSEAPCPCSAKPEFRIAALLEVFAGILIPAADEAARAIAALLARLLRCRILRGEIALLLLALLTRRLLLALLASLLLLTVGLVERLLGALVLRLPIIVLLADWLLLAATFVLVSVHFAIAFHDCTPPKAPRCSRCPN